MLCASASLTARIAYDDDASYLEHTFRRRTAAHEFVVIGTKEVMPLESTEARWGPGDQLGHQGVMLSTSPIILLVSSRQPLRPHRSNRRAGGPGVANMSPVEFGSHRPQPCRNTRPL